MKQKYKTFFLDNHYDGEILVSTDLDKLDLKILESLLRLFHSKTEVKFGDYEHSKDIVQDFLISDDYFLLRIEELRKLNDYKKIRKQLEHSLNKIKDGVSNINNVRGTSLFKEITIAEDSKERMVYPSGEIVTDYFNIYEIKYIWKWSYKELDDFRDFVIPNSATSNKIKD